MNQSNPNVSDPTGIDRDAYAQGWEDRSVLYEQSPLPPQNGPSAMQSAYSGRPASYQQPLYGSASAPSGRSGMAVASMVLGIVALAMSLLPIINNLSFILAIVGLVLALIGVARTRKGKRSGAGMAVAGIVLNILTIIAVLASQSYYSSALNDALSGPGISSTGAAAEQGFQDLTIGTPIQLTNGLSVSVDSVTTGLANHDGSSITQVTVSYRNDGAENVSFNAFDWKGQDAQGAQRTNTLYMQAENQLSAGELAPGGAVSGNLYFDGALSKVVYQTSIFSNGDDASWSVS